VLDKTNANAILFQYTVRDTPNADFCPTVGTIRAPNGWSYYSGPDLAGAPFPSGPSIIIETKQCPGPGEWGALCEVVFDNVVYQIHDPPRLSIDQARRVSWPAALPLPFVLESAPVFQGFWNPVDAPAQDREGIRSVTVPADGPRNFFRLNPFPD
jgi:hypothetical protein